MKNLFVKSVTGVVLCLLTFVFVNAICDGNALYDELYGDTAVYLDVEDVVNDLRQECQVQSANQMVGFTSAHEYRD